VLTRAHLLATLHISERQLARHLAAGLPHIPTGLRGKVFDLEEVTAWLRANACPSAKTPKAAGTPKSASAGAAYIDACRRVQTRTKPAPSKPNFTPPLRVIASRS
jgi:hypothetical protein